MQDELKIREAWDRGEYDLATSLTLHQYGLEVLGFLRATHRQHDDANEAFALLSVRLWRAMASFAWKCSMRTWLYLLARTASADVRRELAKGARIEPPAGEINLPELVAHARTETLSMFRTEKRAAFAELCLELPEDDRELLLLRTARELPWRDVAMIFGANHGLTDERQLEREAARLRKRFQLVRARLRELGRQRGLLP
ncbi:MAG TPA: hypothetical protein VI299_15845 [Polyangiales bacterium]